MHKLMKVSPTLRVWVSQHHEFSDFGIRGRFSGSTASVPHRLGRFICTGTPGTGFFERESESESYIHFVRSFTRLNRMSYWRFLMGGEFSYDAEIRRVNKALESADEEWNRRVLDMYVNCLAIAKRADQYDRMAKGVKRHMHSKPTKETTSALSHLRSRISQLDHEVKGCQWVVDANMTEAEMVRYKQFCDAFEEAMMSRRIWALLNNRGSIEMKRVFWDMGVFNYIRSSTDTPIMRDASGVCYYLYPQFLIRARSSVDFDIIGLKQVHFEYREASGEALTMTGAGFDDMYGRTLGEVYCRELDLSFYFAHRSTALKFAKAYNEYYDTL